MPLTQSRSEVRTKSSWTSPRASPTLREEGDTTHNNTLMTTQQDTPKSKKKDKQSSGRVYKACRGCRTAKKRCSDSRPCERCKALGKVCVDVDGREYDPHHDELLERERQQRLTGAPPPLTIQPPKPTAFNMDASLSSGTTPHMSASTTFSQHQNGGMHSASTTNPMVSPMSSNSVQHNFSNMGHSVASQQHHHQHDYHSHDHDHQHGPNCSHSHHAAPQQHNAISPAMDPDTIASTTQLLNHMQQIRSRIRMNNDKLKPPPNYFVKSFYCDIPVSMIITSNPGTPSTPFLLSCNPAFCRLMQTGVDSLHMKELHEYMPFTVDQNAPQRILNLLLRISQFIGNRVICGNREVQIKSKLYREDFSVHVDDQHTTWHCMYSSISQWSGDCDLYTPEGHVLSTTSSKFSHTEARHNLLQFTLEDLVRQIDQYVGHY